MQATNHILMVRPAGFKFNEQTSDNNKFQQASELSDVHMKALREFDDFVVLLRKHQIDVMVINDTVDTDTPDAIFPNNWVSFHEDGTVFLYPMFSENRRLERRQDILDKLKNQFRLGEIADLSFYEKDHIFLEGTGSLVLDRDNKIAYACSSLRTNEKIVFDFCARTGYSPVIFSAVDAENFPIYHTNVMMCIGDRFTVICLESISNDKELQQVRQSLTDTGKEIIPISLDQMNHFAGNMLQVKDRSGNDLLVMSEQAYLSLTKNQTYALERYCELVFAPLYTIESNGGGSARCMLAEIHLPKR